jgi:predicted RNase H-like nuclease (RuvC/YqgF family)
MQAIREKLRSVNDSLIKAISTISGLRTENRILKDKIFQLEEQMEDSRADNLDAKQQIVDAVNIGAAVLSVRAKQEFPKKVTDSMDLGELASIVNRVMGSMTEILDEQNQEFAELEDTITATDNLSQKLTRVIDGRNG